MHVYGHWRQTPRIWFDSQKHSQHCSVENGSTYAIITCILHHTHTDPSSTVHTPAYINYNLFCVCHETIKCKLPKPNSAQNEHRDLILRFVGRELDSKVAVNGQKECTRLIWHKQVVEATSNSTVPFACCCVLYLSGIADIFSIPFQQVQSTASATVAQE